MKKNRRQLLAWSLALLATLGLGGAGSAQTAGTIQGRIVDGATLRPLASVQVSIPALSRGGLTNARGEYTIVNVPPGAHTIRASLLGYSVSERQITVGAGEAMTLDIPLSESAIALDEIVVTGTAGQARRREIGNSISQVNMTNVVEPVRDVSEILQGRTAGVQVQGSAGSIGAGSSIRLRGTNSVALSNQPLIYVDGVRIRNESYRANGPQGDANRGPNVEANPLSDINPNDIDRIEVIKGAAATTLYGTEAAAGVVQIFTKRGIRGAPQWSAQITQGMARLLPFAPDVPIETGYDYGQSRYLWLDPWLRDGHLQTYSLSVNGGGESMQYFISGAFDNNKGVLPNDAEQKYVVRGNFTIEPIDDVLLQWNTSYTNSSMQQTPSGNNAHGLTLNAYRRDANYFGSYDKARIDGALIQEIDTYVDRLIIGGTAVYTPMQSFTNRLTVGYDLATQESRNLRPYGFFAVPEGVLSDRRFNATILTFDYVGTFATNLAPNLTSSFSFGGQSAEKFSAYVEGQSSNFPGVPVPVVTSGSVPRAFEGRERVINAGFFAQEMLGYLDRYFLTLGARVDGNSAFGSDFGLAFYPKISGSWVLSDEPFWTDSFGAVKLRAAYGKAGRAPGAFDAVRTWNPVSWGTASGFNPGNVGNRDLGPETTTEMELGFDASVLQDRVGLDFTYFRAVTTDALFDVRQVPSSGFTNSQLQNVGELKNEGLEIALNLGLIERRNFGWDFGVNLSTLRSEVVDLGGAPEFTLSGFGRVMEGYPVPVIVGARIMNPDSIANPIIEPNYIYGPNQPTRTISLSSIFALPYGIQLSARGEYMGGHFLNDNGSAQSLSRAVEWPTCYDAYQLIAAGKADELTASQRGICQSANFQVAFVTQAGDFAKLRDVTLRVPVDRWLPGTNNASFSLSAQNWFRWAKDFPVFDPEMGNNSGYNASVRGTSEHIPPAATLVASLRVAF